MKPKVFMSGGSASTDLQAAATDIIFRTIETAGLPPRQMDKNEWSCEQPLRAIRRVIEECDGAVVIAFARYDFPTGIERKKNGKEEELKNIRFPTVWNQIEAAIAYTRRLPQLVIAENGLRDDGLLEGRYDWKVYWTDFKEEDLISEAFADFLDSWKRLVIEGADSRAKGEPLCDIDLSKIPVSALIARLSIPQIWSVISALIGLLIGVATIVFRVGTGKWTWQ